jgi:hypothetical protein
MDLFTYLMAKNGNNTSVHGDLFSYLLGKGQSQIYTVSGVTIYIPNAKKLVSFMMTKESTQETTTGKQLLPVTAIGEKITNGIKFTTNSDGSLTIQGTATANALVTLGATSGSYDSTDIYGNDAFIFNLSGTYTLSTGSTSDKVRIVFIENLPPGYSYLVDTKTTKTFTYAGEARMVVRVENGSVVDETIYPMLESGSSASPYEEYTGGIPSPSPEFPQSVKTVKGYSNLFDISKIREITLNGIALTKNEETGEIILNGTATETSFFDFNIISELAENTIISLSANNPSAMVSGGQLRLQSSDDTTQYAVCYLDSINAKSENVTLTKATDSIQIRIPSGATLSNYIIKPMLNVGIKAFPYVPYGNNYVNVKVVGKNFLNIFIDKSKDFTRTKNGIIEKFNDDGSITYSGTATAQTDFYITNNTYGSTNDNIVLDITKAYTLSLVNNTNTNIQIFIGYGSTSYNTSTARTFTPAANISYVFVRINNGTNLTTPITIYPMLEEGNTITSYEQYKESIIPIPLNGNELVGIENYKDELKVDKSGHVFINKKTGKVVYNGTENWADRPAYTYADRFVLGNGIPSLNRNMLCNYFEVKPNIIYQTYSYICNNDKQVVINFSAKGTTTLEQFKTWLSTHNTEAYYVLEIPNLIDLQTKVNLSLFKGVNNVSNSVDGYMTIEYK